MRAVGVKQPGYLYVLPSIQQMMSKERQEIGDNDSKAEPLLISTASFISPDFQQKKSCGSSSAGSSTAPAAGGEESLMESSAKWIFQAGKSGFSRLAVDELRGFEKP